MNKLLLFGTLLISSLSFSQLNVGLIAQYDFSGDALDASGNNLNGTVNGATLVNDRLGNPNSAYSFDGVDDYIEVTNFPNNYTNYSFCGWVKYIDTTSNGGIFSQAGIQTSSGDTMSSFGFQNSFGGSNYTFRGRHREAGGLYIANYHEVTDLSWHFYVSTFDGDSLKLYVDNQMVSFTLINSSDPKVSQLLIGAGRTQAIPLGFFFNGIIDDLRLYNRELTDCEIEELYTGVNPCNVGIDELTHANKELLKIIDFMGRETEFKPNTPLIYIYSDGTRERVMKIEE